MVNLVEDLYRVRFAVVIMCACENSHILLLLYTEISFVNEVPLPYRAHTTHICTCAYVMVGTD